MIMIIIIIPSLTLGSIYSTYVSGAEQMTEINNSNQTINRFKNPATGRGGKPAGYLQAWSRI